MPNRRAPLFPLSVCLVLSCTSFYGCSGCGSSDSGSGNGDPSQDPQNPRPGETRRECDYPSSLTGQALEAVAYGNAYKADKPEALIDAALATMTLQSKAFDADKVRLFGLNADGTPNASSLSAITWAPTHDAILFRPTLGVNTAILVSNSDNQQKPAAERIPLAVFGRSKKTPYMAFASNPFRTDGNDQMQTFLVNAVRHSTNIASDAPLRVTLAELEESYWARDESGTRAWLRKQFPRSTFNDADACDGAKLDGCIDKGTDLLIVSQSLSNGDDASQVAKSVARALEKGVPIVYANVSRDLNDLGRQILSLLQIGHAGGNFGPNLAITNFDASKTPGALTDEQRSLATMLEHLKSGKFDFTIANARAQGQGQYEEQFHRGAAAVQGMMSALDNSAKDLFGSCGNEVPKLLALLGDSLRRDIHYPLRSSDMGAFLRAYYADHAVLNVRSFAPAQPDRGSFDSRDLSKVSAANKAVTLTSRRDFRSAGVYALPGRPMKVTRNDTGAARVEVFVNSVRSGSTHEWDDGGYSRPKFLRSAGVPLAPGASVTITSVYGGPVQLGFDKNGVDVQVTFENIGEHPHWASPADDARFTQGVASAAYDWVEVSTEAFELHSRAHFFAETMKDPRWNTPVKLAAAIEKYTYDDVHVLAGFQGKGIDKVPEIFDWATKNGFDVPVLDWVKHANMDQPTCGDGCSGNPYDAWWAFSPIGHGDLHELGHSLQNGRFQLSHNGGKLTYANHSVTNWSPFYGANCYFDDHGGDTSDWGVDHKGIFVALQSAHAAGDRAGFSERMDKYFSDILAPGGDSGIRDNYVFFLQAMMMAKTKDKLVNGYHVVPRIHILDRAFGGALGDASKWDANKQKVGFGSYTLDEAKATPNNDFIAVAMSFVTGLDYRDFFDMFGLAVSDKAKAQIASFGFPAVERAYFALDPLGHNHGALSTKSRDIKKITVDGTAPWPLP